MNINVATDGLANDHRQRRSRSSGWAQGSAPRSTASTSRTAWTPATFKAFEAALVEHKVIVLRDQNLDTKQHVEISRLFGELEVHPMRPQGEFPEILVLDNHKDNPVLSTDVWHSDTTFRQNPTRYTILRCQIMPKVGGDTLWADMEAAYEGLERHASGR